jgi:endonuclease/exonuclease/phosphatase family metal-dependent hydrolase
MRNRPSQAPTTLRIVSMNVSGAKPSAVAPPGWGDSDQLRELRRELVDPNQHRRSPPHILCLQECPTPTWASETFVGYNLAAPSVRSHAGYVSLLVRTHPPEDVIAGGSGDDNNKYDSFVVVPCHQNDNSDYDGYHNLSLHEAPAVMARIRRDGFGDVFVASVHLEPFGSGARIRTAQLGTVLDSFETGRCGGREAQSGEDVIGASSSTGSIPVVIAGDTNMRIAEDLDVERGLDLRDAWKDAGANPTTKFTWDTLDHVGGTYNEYYGPSTRSYRARYDRVYYRGGKATTDTGAALLRPTRFELIAHCPISPSRNHFLSDHFGVYAEFELLKDAITLNDRT